MAKILMAGFLHETKTFSPKPTTLHKFEQALGYPGLILGEDMFKFDLYCLIIQMAMGGLEPPTSAL
jgi:microcystin degradation protein MlrC